MEVEKQTRARFLERVGPPLTKLRYMRIATSLAVVLVLASAAPQTLAQSYSRHEVTELRIGQQEFVTLRRQGRVIVSSPDYAALTPIGTRIAAVANAQYFVPFHFMLVRDDSPNAFAVPGGNVYVTSAMMQFAQNQDELAAVLCHETAHDIHHDVLNLRTKDTWVAVVGTLLGTVVNKSRIGRAALQLAETGEADHFSRQVESNADATGARICATAGFNPWGMVWLMKRYQESANGTRPEFFSDHPSDAHRIRDLMAEFKKDPATFGRFSSRPPAATLLP